MSTTQPLPSPRTTPNITPTLRQSYPQTNALQSDNDLEECLVCGVLDKAGLKEAGKLLEWNEADAVVEINMTGVGDPVQLLGLSCTSISILAELAGVGAVASDKQQGPGGVVLISLYG